MVDTKVAPTLLTGKKKSGKSQDEKKQIWKKNLEPGEKTETSNEKEKSNRENKGFYFNSINRQLSVEKKM